MELEEKFLLETITIFESARISLHDDLRSPTDRRHIENAKLLNLIHKIRSGLLRCV